MIVLSTLKMQRGRRLEVRCCIDKALLAHCTVEPEEEGEGLGLAAAFAMIRLKMQQLKGQLLSTDQLTTDMG